MKIPSGSWRALIFVLALPPTMLLARLALGLVEPGSANSLALEASATGAMLMLLAGAGAAFSPEPLAARLGLRSGRLGADALCWAAAGVVGFSHAADGALELAGWRQTGALARIDATLAGLGASELAFPLLALAGGAALGEEVFFRGLLQRGLEEKLGAPLAVLTAAAAFGLVHADLGQGSAAFGLGLYLGWIAHVAGSIRPAIAAHALNNGLAVLEVASGARPAAPGTTLVLGLGVAALGIWFVGRRLRPPG